MVVPLPPYGSIYWTQPYLCNYTTCPLDPFGQLFYRPSLGGNALYLSIFVLGLLVASGLSIKYKTWGYLAAIIGGAGLEVIGYAGRLMLWQDDFNNNNFIIYLVGLTIVSTLSQVISDGHLVFLWIDLCWETAGFL